ncbi:MAG: MFS transporter [Clostridia bacterium]|nr:MFS transporter [Clostridia bacterium]
MSERNYKMTKLACYSAYFTMSSIFCLPPLLFVIFHESYGISWTLLGTLVLTNFCTQLAVDLIFTLFSKKFNVALVVRVMPIITATGMLIYALSPLLFPNAVYVGLLIGTVIFSVSAGLSEVLLSPLIAAIPSKNPQRDMSLLHSLYAFGVFFVVVVGTLSLKLVGEENWQYVTAFFALLPVIAAVLFMLSPMPDMSGGESGSTRKGGDKRNYIGIALCALCIFLGSCAENVMSNWISSFMDAHLGIDKALGDIIGVAAFAILLGITRISYAKWGKHIEKMLLVGMIGSAVCYLVAGLVTSVAVATVACVLTGVFVAMLWPGTLILMEEKIPGVGVAAFALMAASGDLGASVAPQLMGIIADNAGLDTGMLVTAIFPTLGTALVLVIIRFFGRKKDCPSLKLTESE